MRLILMAALLALTACSGGREENAQPADVLFARLASLCGKAFEGRVVSTDEADAAFATEKLVMQVRDCNDDVLRIPFHVGEDRSRTWVVTRTEEGLRLKHDHRHEDGTEDAVTQYGGDSANVTATRAEFPVDQFSIDLFQREGLTASVTNVWAIEAAGGVFAYELSREDRFFRVEFDLATPVAAPPPPWGEEG